MTSDVTNGVCLNDCKNIGRVLIYNMFASNKYMTPSRKHSLALGARFAVGDKPEVVGHCICFVLREFHV